ncbi:MAG: HAD family phosphatase [Oscillospiraceae bacterium]|nr:HAD family phosphatase [Oscillospiraceae bacterium]
MNIIVDMDGVIFDSERVVLESWQQIAEKYGLENIRDVFLQCIGTNSARTKEIFLSHYGDAFPYDEYRSEMSKLYHDRCDGGNLPLKPGIRELLTALRAAGWSVAIASSTRSFVISDQIRDAGLDSFFDVIIGGDMIKRSKPAPDIFLAAAEKLGTVPADTYVIEDSFNGVRAAHAGGFITIMVPDMLTPDDEMREKARYIAHDLFEVKAYLSL